MIKFDAEKVLLLHQLMAESTGGSIGVRDAALLDSALESAFATFDGHELYPSKEEKAAKIAYSLISNHALLDGNKRIGLYVMLSFLELNGVSLSVSNEDIISLGLDVASGTKKYEEILKWIQVHKVLK